MSRRAALVPVWATCLAFVCPATGVSAQATEEELLRRIDSLLPRLEEARTAEAEALRRRAAEEAARDMAEVASFSVGPLRIVSFPEQAELAAELFGEVWRESFPNVGASPSLARHAFFFEWRRGRLRSVPAASVGSDVEIRRVALTRTWVRSREGVKNRIRDEIWAALRYDLPEGSPLRSWISTTTRYAAPTDVYRAFAVTPSGAVRACLAGEQGACEAALGLDFTRAGQRLAEWFPDQERQAMVRLATRPWDARADPDDPIVAACLDGSDMDSCDRVVRERIRWSPVVWTPAEANLDMLWHAVEVGGDGAWQRARERGGADPAEVLAHVSGLRPPELAASWRASLMGRRPDAYAGMGLTLGSAVFWILVLAAFATRSTRWRLG